jgi:hypothetical protein
MWNATPSVTELRLFFRATGLGCVLPQPAYEGMPVHSFHVGGRP